VISDLAPQLNTLSSCVTATPWLDRAEVTAAAKSLALNTLPAGD